MCTYDVEKRFSSATMLYRIPRVPCSQPVLAVFENVTGLTKTKMHWGMFIHWVSKLCVPSNTVRPMMLFLYTHSSLPFGSLSHSPPSDKPIYGIQFSLFAIVSLVLPAQCNTLDRNCHFVLGTLLNSVI